MGYAHWLVAIAVMSLGGGANAQSIHSCQTAKREIVHRSQPCLRGERTLKVRHYQVPVDTAVGRQRLQESNEWQLRKQARVPTSDSQTFSQRAWEPDPRTLACESARQHRKRVLDQVGLHRNFDLLRQLDEQVREACKGR